MERDKRGEFLGWHARIVHLISGRCCELVIRNFMIDFMTDVRNCCAIIGLDVR